jgi:hypothetical protein
MIQAPKREKIIMKSRYQEKTKKIIYKNFKGKDLSDLNLNYHDLQFCNFSGADLSNTNFCGANLCFSIFDKAELSKANFTNANLENTSFHDANLSHAKFKNANLKNADFSAYAYTFPYTSGSAELFLKMEDHDLHFSLGTILTSANFTNANVCGANFLHTNLYNTIFRNITVNKHTRFGDASIMMQLNRTQKKDLTHAFHESHQKDSLDQLCRYVSHSLLSGTSAYSSIFHQDILSNIHFFLYQLWQFDIQQANENLFYLKNIFTKFPEIINSNQIFILTIKNTLFNKEFINYNKWQHIKNAAQNSEDNDSFDFFGLYSLFSSSAAHEKTAVINLREAIKKDKLAELVRSKEGEHSRLAKKP